MKRPRKSKIQALPFPPYDTSCISLSPRSAPVPVRGLGRLRCVTKQNPRFCARSPLARRIFTPLLIQMPVNKVMGLGLSGYGSTEGFQGAGELSGSVGSSCGPTSCWTPLWPLPLPSAKSPAWPVARRVLFFHLAVEPTVLPSDFHFAH